MSIATPEQALTIDELPTATPEDSGIQVLVNTKLGAKKLPLESIYEPYNLLIGTYQYYTGLTFPTQWAVPALGGVLDPQDFEDSLQILKERVPSSWILSDGKVQLPYITDHVLQQDMSLAVGAFQNDAMQKIEGKVNIFRSKRSYPSGGLFEGTVSTNIVEYRLPKDLSKIYSTYRLDHYVVNFDNSRKVRTANHNREKTINALLCVFAGRIKSTKTRSFQVKNPTTQSPTGWSIQLAIGRDNQPIGFNSSIFVQS